MKLNDRQKVMIKDLLHNLHPHSVGGTQAEKAMYAKGMLVGVVGMLQAFATDDSFDFEKAMAITSELAPSYVVAGCCPPSWEEQFKMPQTKGQDASWDDRGVVRLTS